jgi:peptidase MA superfamily protein
MGKALRRGVGKGGGWGTARVAGNRERGTGNRSSAEPLFPVPCSRFPVSLAVGLLLAVTQHAGAQDSASRHDHGRFTILAYKTDELLAKALLASAVARDTFPGLARPTQRVVIAIAPDHRRFREWIGPTAPEWGAAVAFPESSRIVMQGRDAASDAGDPVEVLRHELAHLALHEALGDLPPRWFDEGYASYAANEVARDAVLGANLALLFRGMPPLDSLDAGFAGGSLRAEGTYALAYRAVAELAASDPERGLTLFFRYWKETGRFEAAVRSAYGITQGQFEEIWRARTRRRYGGLALAADLSIAAAVTLFIVMPFYVIRRRRDRLRMAALVRADEEAERRERESVIEALLRSISPPMTGAGDPPPTPPPDESAGPAREQS